MHQSWVRSKWVKSFKTLKLKQALLFCLIDQPMQERQRTYLLLLVGTSPNPWGYKSKVLESFNFGPEFFNGGSEFNLIKLPLSSWGACKCIPLDEP